MHLDVGIGPGFFGSTLDTVGLVRPKAHHNTNSGGLGQHNMNDRAGLGLPNKHDGRHVMPIWVVLEPTRYETGRGRACVRGAWYASCRGTGEVVSLHLSSLAH